jgi:hypothetical protein
MRKINYAKVRRSSQADLRRYERIGVKDIYRGIEGAGKGECPLVAYAGGLH